MRRALIAAATLSSLLSPAGARAADRASPVGFTLTIESDPRRTYEVVAGEGHAARPVLLAVWYPAQARADQSALRTGELSTVATADPKLRAFASRVSAQNRDAHARYGLGFDPDRLSAAQKRQLEQLLGRPTHSVRDATAAPGRFPVVLYHHGLGGSFDDNLVLCEELARAGFVVVASAFQPRDASEVATDYDFERSFDDIELLLRALERRWPQADASRVAVVGHSFGAQVALAYAEAHGGVRAVVALDSTLENMDSADDPAFADPSAQTFLGQPELLRAPTLAVATRAGHWWYLDGARYAERTLVVADVQHAQLTSQGALPGGGAGEHAYRDLIGLTRSHLAAALLGAAPVAAAALATLHVEKRAAVPEGPSTLALSERAQRDVNGAIALCEHSMSLDPEACRPDVVFAAAATLRRQGRDGAAVALLRWNTRRRPTSPLGFVELGDALHDAGDQAEARQAYQSARAQLAHIGPPPMRARLAERIARALGDVTPPAARK